MAEVTKHHSLLYVCNNLNWFNFLRTCESHRPKISWFPFLSFLKILKKKGGEKRKNKVKFINLPTESAHLIIIRVDIYVDISVQKYFKKFPVVSIILAPRTHSQTAVQASRWKHTQHKKQNFVVGKIELAIGLGIKLWASLSNKSGSK